MLARLSYESGFLYMRTFQIFPESVISHRDVEKERNGESMDNLSFYVVNGKSHAGSKKLPPTLAADLDYSNLFNLQYSGILSDHGNRLSM